MIFVDTGVQNHQELLENLLSTWGEDRYVDIHFLDAARDGVEQIGNILAGSADLDAVHIVSHGTSGQFKLGATWLNLDRLAGYAGDVARWGQSLKSDADLLIYGCDLASTADGRTLVEAISSLTGADVAASSDQTGTASLGGDWELEFTTGQVAGALKLDASLPATWQGLLEVVTVNTTTDWVDPDADLTSLSNLAATPGSDGKISLREAILAANAAGDADEIVLLAGDYRLNLGGTDDSGAFGDLDIVNPLTISRAGAAQTTIDGERIDRVFDIFADTQISGVTIEDGLAVQGGALRVTAGTLALERSIVQLNEAQEGAGIDNRSGLLLAEVEILNNNATLGTNQGGGLRNNSTATLQRVLFEGNTATGGLATNWDEFDVVGFDGPGLTLGAATTGTFSVPFGFTPQEGIRGLHYVSTATTVGDSGTDFDLLPGDLLVVFDSAGPGATFGSVANVTKSDVMLYRPGIGNDYANGTYSMLLDDPIDDGGAVNLRAISLVERDTRVGEVLLEAGTLIFARPGDAEANNVYYL